MRPLRITIGKNAYKDGKNDYAGRTGNISYCETCCDDWRVSFDGIANNELLRNFDLSKCIIYLTALEKRN